MRLRPLFATLTLLILATLAEPVLPFSAAALALGAVVVALLGAMVLRVWPVLGVAALLMAILGIGLFRAREVRTPSPADPLAHWGQMATLTGRVEEPPEAGARGSVHFTLRTSTGRVWCQLRDAPGPALGETISIRGRVEAPPPATNPGQFDWKAHLARQGIYTLLSGRSWHSVAPPGPLDRVLAGVRRGIQSASARNLAPGDAALLDGLLLSARAGLPVTQEDAFQRTGAVHVLSVSGLHLAALGLFLNLLLTHVLPTRQGVRTGISLLVIWLFALAVGAPPAALRSAVMLSVLLLAPLLKRDAEPLHSLAFAAVIVLLQNPQALFDPGTQLSFVACTGLILFVPPLETLLFPWEPDRGVVARIVRWFRLAFAASVVAHLTTWPLVAWHFHVFSLVAPVASVPLTALSEALLLAGLLAIPFGVLPVLGTAWWGLIGLGLRLLQGAASYLAAPPWAAVSIASPPLVGIVVYYLCLFGAALYVRKLARRHLFAPTPAAAPFRLSARPPAPAGHVP
jgi:competence protein ComEC